MTLNVAYFTNQHSKANCIFIQRAILALGRQGIRVLRRAVLSPLLHFLSAPRLAVRMALRADRPIPLYTFCVHDWEEFDKPQTGGRPHSDGASSARMSASLAIAKTAVRDIVAKLLFMTNLTAPASRGDGRLSIITFHRVLPEADRQAYPYPGLVVTPDELDEFLTYFTEYFDCGALATQHERLLTGNISGRPLLAITFDDAQHDNYLHARPVLARRKLKATFFVPVAAVERRELLWHDRLGFAILALIRQTHGREQLMRILAAAGLPASVGQDLVSSVVQAAKRLRPEARMRLVDSLAHAAGSAPAPEFARLMTFEEIAELAADGHEIGSHSMTHCMMPECDDGSLRYEIAESRKVLQSHLGRQIETFCYPNGNSDARTARAVAQAGYQRAVTTMWGSNEKAADRFALCRFDMVARHVQDLRGSFMPATLALRMSGFHPGLRSRR